MASEPSRREENQGDAGYPAKMVWSAGPELDAVFTDQMHLAKINDQFYLTFGQIRILSWPGEPPESGTEIRPIARVIIPKSAMAKFVALLQSGLNEWGE